MPMTRRVRRAVVGSSVYAPNDVSTTLRVPDQYRTGIRTSAFELRRLIFEP